MAYYGVVFATCFSLICASLLPAQSTGLIPNASFESGQQVPSSTGGYSQLIPGSTFAAAAGSLDNWTATSTTTNAAAGSFTPSPGGSNWTTKQWDGNSIGYLQINGAGTVSMSQTLSTRLENDKAYTLDFIYGRRAYSPRARVEFQLWAGATRLGSSLSSDDNAAPQQYWFPGGSVAIRYSSGADNANAGQNLRIVIVTTGVAGIITEGFFDKLDLQVVAGPLLAPAIKAGGVVPVFSSATTIQPGSWVSIYGSNFILNTTSWKGDFPTSLGGVSVTINSKPAYLWYVSRNQINLQAPVDTDTGAVLVTVTTPLGKASAAVTLGKYAPSFSLLNEKYAAAIVVTPGQPGNSGGGYDIIGPAGSALGYPTRPVRPGETLVLYGVGFGPTTPPVPAGLPFYGAATCVDLPKITIGGVPATVSFGGVVSAGLFQFNVVVPSASSGDQPLQALAGGLMSPNGAYISVQ